MGPKEFCRGTGRRKTAIARVRLRPGSGKITVNGRELENYFSLPQDQSAVKAPLEATNSLTAFDVWIDVYGGGSTGQSGATKLGVARALVQANPELFTTLRDKGYLTRDSRMKERKKYGQRGARRRYQFSKR
ncbi:MAG: 30S ribosomal protein S9 [Sedimentisphaerales bacterium]|nr:30S ribosomal protein S9 [Sedimentisphaerales bacterium]